jgi:integrase
MATIYKRIRLQPIPTGAAIVERGGKLFAEWTNRKTKRRQRAPLNDDGTKVAIESSGYEIEYVDHNGERKRKSTRCPDRDAAQQLANEIERNVMLRKEGIVNPADDRYSAEGRRPLKTHLEEFKAALAGRANTLQHCEETFTKATRIVALCAAAFIHDLTASAVQAAVGKLKDGGKSLKTCNHYLRAIKSFSRWLRGDKRSREDALATLKAFNSATDPKHVRREITPEETSRLLATTEKRSRKEHNMPGPDRVMAYRLALGTGFRVLELRSLAPSSFELDSDPPTVTVAAAHSKRRRTDAQPIRRDLASAVREWLGDKPDGELLFTKLPQDTAKMLRRDLKAARAEWIAEGATDAEKELREKSDFLTYEDSAGGICAIPTFRRS